MGSREFKNHLKLRQRAYGPERRSNLAKEILKDSSPLPNPLEHKDIDEEFKRWVDEELELSYEGERVPTIALFSNQRFSEYMQSWNNVDNKKNLILNFKIVTRENNPKPGTINGSTRNIPGERTYLMKRVEAYDKNNRKYYIDYRVKQPIALDFTYNVNVITNKYELLNKFNLMINDKFKSINCYIRPKGHFMAMELSDISDESEYSIDDRQYYSQSCSIKVMGYIMPEDSFIVEEKPLLKFKGFEGDMMEKSYAEIDDNPCAFENLPYSYEPIHLKINIDKCSSSYTLKDSLGFDFNVTSFKLENIRSFNFYINDEEVELTDNMVIKSSDMIKVKNVKRYKITEKSVIEIEGYDKNSLIENNKNEIELQ